MAIGVNITKNKIAKIIGLIIFPNSTPKRIQSLLKGVRIQNNYAHTHSVVMRSKTGTIRYINANHNLNIKKYRSYFK